MSDFSDSKRRRILAPAAANISSLPDAVLQQCFSFVGPGHYRYVASVSHWFQNVYNLKYESKTTWDSAAASVSRAELCLEDEREQGWDGRLNVEDYERSPMREIALAAARTGRLNILEWAYSKGFKFINTLLARVDGFYLSSPVFFLAAQNGHISVLEWAESKNVEISSNSNKLAVGAGRGGQVVVLDWLKDRGMMLMPTNFEGAHNISREAANRGHMQVLDWLLDYGFDHVTVEYSAVASAAQQQGNVSVLEWAKDNGYDFTNDRNRQVCLYASMHENLSILQWLRQNNCPWDGRVVSRSRLWGRWEIVEWAIANGCPDPDVEG